MTRHESNLCAPNFDTLKEDLDVLQSQVFGTQRFDQLCNSTLTTSVLVGGVYFVLRFSFAQVLMDEEAVLQMMQRDLDVLSNEEENSKLRLRLAIGAQILVGLSPECKMQNEQNALSSDLNNIRRSWSFSGSHEWRLDDGGWRARPLW